LLAFWLYLLVMTLLVPAVMLGFGHRFQKNPPKRINDLFGYRTRRSMRNWESWEYAHLVCGRFWWWAGWPALTFALVMMGRTVSAPIEEMAEASVLVVAIQMILLVLAIPWTERALKQKLDRKEL